jgi:hypothetical protein
MHRPAILFVLAAACGGRQNTGPVAGAHEAMARHYPVTVVQAHTALVDVLTKKYGAIATDDGLHVVARTVCRDTDGDRCAQYTDQPLNAGGPSAMFSNSAPSTVRVGHYWFQVAAGVVGSDGDVQIQLGARAKDFHEQQIDSSAPGAPAWMPHEVDEIQVAVDHALAQK